MKGAQREIIYHIYVFIWCGCPCTTPESGVLPGHPTQIKISWRHAMETPVTSGLSSRTDSNAVFFLFIYLFIHSFFGEVGGVVVRLSQPFKKQLRCRWSETPWHSWGATVIEYDSYQLTKVAYVGLCQAGRLFHDSPCDFIHIQCKYTCTRFLYWYKSNSHLCFEQMFRQIATPMNIYKRSFCHHCWDFRRGKWSRLT